MLSKSEQEAELFMPAFTDDIGAWVRSVVVTVAMMSTLAALTSTRTLSEGTPASTAMVEAILDFTSSV